MLDTAYSAISRRFVIVTAEYNCSLPPALTNLLDYFPPASFRHVNAMSTHCQHIVNSPVNILLQVVNGHGLISATWFQLNVLRKNILKIIYI